MKSENIINYGVFSGGVDINVLNLCIAMPKVFGGIECENINNKLIQYEKNSIIGNNGLGVAKLGCGNQSGTQGLHQR